LVAIDERNRLERDQEMVNEEPCQQKPQIVHEVGFLAKTEVSQKFPEPRW